MKNSTSLKQDMFITSFNGNLNNTILQQNNMYNMILQFMQK